MAAETRREKAKAERRRVDAREMAKQDAKKGSFSMNHVKVPDGMPTIRFKEDKLYQFDIVPFVAGKENPNADEGVETYERRVYAHSGIGLDQRAFYVCPLETSKRGRAKKLRPCPVCEHAAKMALRGDDWDARKPFMPKERQIMQVIDLEDRKKGVQLFEGSFNKGLGELLKNKLSKLPEDSKKKWFWTYDEGMHLHVGVEQDTFKGQSYFKPVNVEFEQRDKQYGPEFMEKGVCLDDLVAEAELSYDELAEIFHQSPSADDNGDAEPARNGTGHSRARPADADDEEQDDVPTFKRGDKVKHREFGLCDVVHVSGDGTSLKLEDEEGELHNAVDPADCKPAAKGKPAADDGDDDDDDDPPARPQAKKSRTGQDDVDEDDGDDDDDDDDDDEPPTKAQGKKGKPAPVDDDDEDDDQDDEDDEEDDDDEPPTKAGKAKGKKPAAAEEDDGDDEWEDEGDDDDWDDDDDEPVKAKAKGKSPPAKPAGKKGKK